MKPDPSRAIKRIHFVEYNAKINTLAMAKVFPKYGTALLASILRERGYDVRMHLEGVSDMRFETLSDCDLLCMPLFGPAYNKVIGLAKRLAEDKPNIPVVIGGPQAMLHPETVVEHCDYTVRCEGDEVLPELVDRLNDGGDVGSVKGLWFMRDGEIVDTGERRPPAVPETIADLELIDGFKEAASGLRRLRTVVNTLQTSRGCAYKCRFCPTPKLFPGAYRNRDIDSVIAEIEHKMRYNDFFFVVDNNFFGNKERSVALLERLVKENLGAQLMVFARQEIGHDREMLELMAAAGVKCSIVGVESLEDEALEAFDKRQTSRDVIQSIKNMKATGIHVMATFAFGYEGDDARKAKQIIRFVKDNELSLNVFILHDGEHDPRRKLLIPLERRFYTHYDKTDPSSTAHHDYGTGSFVTYFPKHMKPSTLQRTFLDIYKDLYTDKHILRTMLSPSSFVSVFGIAHGYGVRRLNETIEQVCDDGYMDYLRRLEEGLYDADERLIEERLGDLEGLPLPPPLAEQVDDSSYNQLIDLAMVPGVARQAVHKVRWGISRYAGRLATGRWPLQRSA